ncbi:hypothetical protein K458DRAFT_429966, partial [Lentithecium fluviatile CBS 122367]
MRSLLLPLATLLPLALANWDPQLCGGGGGCLQISWWPGTDFSCPDGTHLTQQKVAQESIDLDSGVYDVVTNDKFPSSCLRGVKPGAEDTLAVHHAASGHQFFVFIKETCTETNPIADCYNQNPNPSTDTICQIATMDGKFCKQ